MDLNKFKEQYPMYAKYDDETLGKAIYKKFYGPGTPNAMPEETFWQKVKGAAKEWGTNAQRGLEEMGASFQPQIEEIKNKVGDLFPTTDDKIELKKLAKAPGAMIKGTGDVLAIIGSGMIASPLSGGARAAGTMLASAAGVPRNEIASYGKAAQQEALNMYQYNPRLPETPDIIEKSMRHDPTSKAFGAGLEGIEKGATNLLGDEMGGFVAGITEAVLPFIGGKKGGRGVKAFIKDPLNEAAHYVNPESGARGSFVGKGARGWDKMEGKFSNLYDKKERAEISDKDARLKVENIGKNQFDQNLLSFYKKKFDDPNLRLGDILEHDKLFAAYPELMYMPIKSTSGFNPFVMGEYKNKEISLAGGKPKQVLNTLMHEVQHYIQEREKFAMGGSSSKFLPVNFGKIKADAVSKLNETVNKVLDAHPKLEGKHNIVYWAGQYANNGPMLKNMKRLGLEKYSILPKSPLFPELKKRVLDYETVQKMENDAFLKYKQIAGEVEARDTANRLSLSEEERMRTGPYTSENIPVSDWKKGVAQGNNMLSSKGPKEPEKPKPINILEGKSLKMDKTMDTRVGDFMKSLTPEELESLAKAYKRDNPNDYDATEFFMRYKYPKQLEILKKAGIKPTNRYDEVDIFWELPEDEQLRILNKVGIYGKEATTQAGKNAFLSEAKRFIDMDQKQLIADAMLKKSITGDITDKQKARFKQLSDISYKKRTLKEIEEYEDLLGRQILWQDIQEEAAKAKKEGKVEVPKRSLEVVKSGNEKKPSDKVTYVEDGQIKRGEKMFWPKEPEKVRNNKKTVNEIESEINNKKLSSISSKTDKDYYNKGMLTGEELSDRLKSSNINSLRPAVMHKGVKYEGKVGDTHPDVMKVNNIGPDASHTRGFVNDAGHFMSRKDAKNWMKKNRSDQYEAWVKEVEGDEGASLHSQDLNKAIKEAGKESGQKQPVTSNSVKGLGKGFNPGERGSFSNKPLTGKDRWTSPTNEMIKLQKEEKMPPGEWLKRIGAWGDKHPSIKDENKWSGVEDYIKSRLGDKTINKQNIVDFYELSKGKWAERKQTHGKTEIEEDFPKGWKVIKSPKSRDGYLLVDNNNNEVYRTQSKDAIMAEEQLKYIYAKSQGKSPDPWASHNIPGGIRGTEKVYTLQVPSKESNSYQSPHFSDQSNVVIHFRTQERMDAQGKKGLMIETIQSDWHQGREKGVEYKGNIIDPFTNEPFESKYVGTPPAPFEKSWAEVGLKHALDIAAQDKTIEWVGWPSGKVQNKRWGKQKGAEILEDQPMFGNITRVDKDTYQVTMDNGFDRVIKIKKSVTKDELLDMFDSFGVETNRKDAINQPIGKSVKLFNAVPNGGSSVYDDFSLGDTFLETLYDKRLPKFASKYSEKLGGKYKKDKLYPHSSKFEVDADPAITKEDTYDIHRIDLTPALKSHINTKGQSFYKVPLAIGAAAAANQLGGNE